MDKTSLIDRVKAWAGAMKRDVAALWIAARDARVPWPARLTAALVAAYALSPVDLIPDFVPVLGYLDDLVLIPAGIWLAVKLIPPPLMEELRKMAGERAAARSMAGLSIVAAIWVAAILLTWSVV